MTTLAYGCTMFGSSTAAKPDLIGKLTAEVEQARKEINDIKEDYVAGGDINRINERFDLVFTQINNINNQISSISTTHNNTPFWEIAMPLILGYLAWELLKFWKAYKVAHVNAGSTLRNLVGLK